MTSRRVIIDIADNSDAQVDLIVPLASAVNIPPDYRMGHALAVRPGDDDTIVVTVDKTTRSNWEALTMLFGATVGTEMRRVLELDENPWAQHQFQVPQPVMEVGLSYLQQDIQSSTGSTKPRRPGTTNGRGRRGRARSKR